MKKLFLLCALLTAFTAKVWATDVAVAAQSLSSVPFNATNLPSDVTLSNVSVTNGSAAVTCSACLRSQWVGIGGFTIAINGVAYTVSTVTSTSAFTLTANYAAATSAAATVIWYKYAELRFYADRTFIPASSTQPVQPGAPGSSSWYRRVACSIVNDGANNVLYIPAVTLPATTDATAPTNTARFTAAFYRPDGSLIALYGCFDSFRIPATTPTTWAALCTYNSPPAIVPPANEAYTKAAIDARFPSCSSGLMLYYAATGNVQSCLTVGAGLQISSGTITSTAGSADPPAAAVQYNNGANAFAGDAGFLYDDTTGTVQIGTPTVRTGSLQIRNSSNSFSTTLTAGAPSGSITVTLPSALPGSTQCLQISSAGVISAAGAACGTGSGITTLNTLTAATQTFAVGSSGSDFAVSSATSTHTFNLPTASASNRGALSTADWSAFNAKIGGSGTVDRIPRFDTTSTIANSILAQSGSSEIYFAGGSRFNLGSNAVTTIEVANEGVTGTINDRLAKLTGAPSTVMRLATTDTTKITGLVVANGSTTGSAKIAISGTANCEFDGATTAGNFVGSSAITAGKCADLGSTLPTSGAQVIGRVLTTNGSSGTYSVLLTGFDPAGYNGNLAGSGTTGYVALWSSSTGLTTATDLFRDIATDPGNPEYVFQDNIHVFTTSATSRIRVDTNQFVLNASATRTTGTHMLNMRAVASQTGDFLRTTDAVGTVVYRVDIDGDMHPRGVTTAWPAANAAGILTNNGSGTLTWNTAIPSSNIRQALNAKLDYSAVGNGVANDTTAIQNCMTASAASGGKECYIPAGTYLVTGLTLADDTHIVGDGKGKTIITSATDAAIIAVSATAFRSTIRSLTIDGNAAGSSQIGLNLAGSGDYSAVHVEDVYIQDTGSHGLYVSRAFSTSFNRLDFSSCGNTSNSWAINIDANDKPNITLRDIYVHQVVSSNPTAYRIKGGAITCYNCNGIDNAASNSYWVRIGKKNGVDGDVTDQSAGFACYQCNLETWTLTAAHAYYNSNFTCIGCTFYPDGGATSAKRAVQYEVDSAQFPAFFTRGLIDETSVIDGPESSYANGAAFHSNEQPPLRFDGYGPRVLTGGSNGRISSYYDTGQSRANPVGRDGSIVARTTITASTSFSRTGVAVVEVNCAAACTVTLPYAGYYDGANTEPVIVKDISGAAATNNITVQSNGGSTVNGAASYAINQNGQSVVFMPSSTADDWRIVAANTGGVTGSGTSPRLAYWSSTSVLTSTSGFEIDTGNSALKSAGRFWGDATTAGAPTFSFTADNDTGFYREAANTIGISIGGTKRAQIESYLTMYAWGAGAGETGSIRLYDLDGSAYVAVRAADTTTTYNVTLPAAAPAGTECLQMSSAGAITTTGGICGGAAGASLALDNLASVSINTSLIPQTGVDLGAQATPFNDIWFYGSGTFGSHSIKLAGTPTGHRVATFPDSSLTLAGIDLAQTWTAIQTYGTGLLRPTSPRITTGILDSGGNELFLFTATGSAVNEFTVTNNATGNAPILSATGGDTNINIALTPKGTGQVVATNGVTIAGYSITTAADQTVMMLDANGTIAKNDSNTRTFYGAKLAPTLNAGVSNANTTFNVIYAAVEVTDSTGITTNLLKLDYAASERFSIGSTGLLAFADGVRQIFNPNNTNAGLNVGGNASDPSSPANGDLYYDSDDHLLRARINSAWVSLGAGGSAPPFTDTTNIIAGSGDSSKLLRIEADGISTSTVRVWTAPDADITVAGVGFAQTWTAIQTYGSGLMRATSPRITTAILDANGNELFLLTANASAVNEFTVANGATGSNPVISATGGDADVGISLLVKGAGVYNFFATTSGPTDARWFEDADNGSNYVSIIAAASLASNFVLTLPSATDTLAGIAATQTLTNKTLSTSNTVSAALTWSDGVKQTFNPDATNSGINVGAQAGDVGSPADGDIWYNSSTGKLRCRQNGATADCVSASAAAGGSDTQVQRNNAGSLGGISGLTSDGTNMTAGSGNFTATRPKVVTSLDDSGGNEVFKVTATASAVNEVTLVNGATGSPYQINASGGDTDVSVNMNPKGAGGIGVNLGSTNPTAMLHVKARASSNEGIQVDSNSGTISGAITSDGSSFLIGTSTNHTLDLITNGTTRLSITGAGAANFGGALTVGSVAVPTISSTSTFTGKTLNAESSGNVVTLPFKTYLPVAGCNNATAAPVWNLPTSTAPTATCVTGSNRQKGVLSFPDSDGDYSAQIETLIPADWTGAVDVKIRWYSATATSGDVVWQVSTSCVADGETDDPAWNTASTVTDTAKGTVDQMNDATISTLTVTGCAAGEMMNLRVLRNRTHASDTITGAVLLLGLEVTARREM